MPRAGTFAAQSVLTAMRRFLLILMIALLPMRGWAADMMAVAMAAQHLHAVQSIQAAYDGLNTAAEATGQVQPSMLADCPMMAMPTGKPASDSNDKAGSPIFKVCTSCQLCMALATEHPQVLALAPFASHAPPVSRVFEFAGVTVAAAIKPPIA